MFSKDDNRLKRKYDASGVGETINQGPDSHSFGAGNVTNNNFNNAGKLY